MNPYPEEITMTMTAVRPTYQCPLCPAFPFDTPTELGEHIAAGHDDTPSHRRFETVPNGFGGTTTVRTTPTVVDEATPKQVAFLARLAAERGVEVDLGGMTKAAASRRIDEMLAAPRPTPEAKPQQVVEVGMYRVGEVIYKVQVSRQSRNLYAKVLGGTQEGGYHFDYEAGAIRQVREHGVRLTLDEAQQFGRETGTCCVCAAVLTNPESIALGIGPICGGRI